MRLYQISENRKNLSEIVNEFSQIGTFWNGEGTVFTDVCLFTKGAGVPPSHNTFIHCSHVLSGGYPSAWPHVPLGVRVSLSTPQLGGGGGSLSWPGQGTPHWDWMGVSPSIGTGWGTPLWTEWSTPQLELDGYPHPPQGDRAEQVLATWRTVYLLRSRRRICLFKVYLLPTAYVVREEVIFSLCLSVHRGGVPRPAPGGGGTPSSWLGGVPRPAPGGGGYPIQLARGGYPIPGLGGGTPPAGVPPRLGYPPPHPGTCYGRGRYASCVHAGGLSCLFNCSTNVFVLII